MINLRPYNQSTREISDTWDEFSISSWTSETGWTEHCRGQVSVQKNESSNPFHSIDHSGASQGEVQTQMLELDTACKSEVDWENWLQTFSKGGIEYGPTFRGLTDVRVGGKHAVSLVQIPDTAATMPLGYESDYIIHPCTLDACCQASFPAFTSGQQLEQAYVPTFIKSLSVSHGFNSNPGDRLNNYFSVDPESKDEIRASGFVMNLSRNKASPILRIEGLTLSPLPCDDSDSSGTQKDDLCAQVTWEPSIDLLTTDQFTGLLGQDQIPEAEKLKFDVFEQAAYYLTERALKEVDPAEYDGFQEHHKKMYRWLQSEMNAASHGGLPMQTPDWMELDPTGRENFLQAVRNIGPDGELLCKIGEALPSIMRQEIDPLSIMFEDKLLDRWYQTNASLACGYARNARFVDMLGHQNPYLNILEIGGGTAGTTVPTLEALGGYGGKMARFVKYTFTDISAGFFEPAKQKLERWGGLVSYAKLDIEQDPIEQGFQAEAYDLVIAANVLHATSKMDRTLHHVRKLLKPGGKLALLEVTMTQLQHLIFATLPGWWLSEGPGYEKGPVMDEGRWDSLLKNAGFSGIDCSLQDFPREPEQNGSMMYSTAVSPGPEEVPEVVIVCENPPDGLPMKKLHEQVHALTGRTPTLASLGEEDVSGKICIFIQELNKPLLVDISPHSFEDIQKLFSVAHSVLWVVQDANIDCRNPDASMAIGLLRTIRSETGMRIVTLDLDKYQSPDGQSIVDTIARVFKWTLVSTKSSSLNTEMEYVERGGIVRIPRLVLASELNRGIDREMFEGSPELQQFPQKGRPLKMVAKQPGLLESLCFVEDEVPKTVLKDADVEISVKAVGLNFKDVLIAMGQVPDEPLGGELGGIINSVGSDVSTFTVGDRVCAAPSGSFAELVRCPSSMVAKIPDNVSFAEAASLPIAFITAYYSLIEVGRLNSGESVLIHAASGGVGQAAIQVAKMVGAHIYATVSTVEKRSHLIETYGIPENQIFYSRDTSFGEEIMRASQNRGVDVVLNSLSGEALHTSWECLAAYGRFVEIGKRDLQLNSRLGMQKFMRNSTFTAVDLGAIRADRPQLFMRVFRKVLELVAENALRAVTPLNAFSFSQMEQAFRLMQSGKHNGKIVLQVQKGDKVMVCRKKIIQSEARPSLRYLTPII
jgi:NADPH:quinone reductase-like Zn-dependent oxidoreductase/ubiquinone/menaquinone biosynthesis C-methylase UbiE